LSKEEVLPSNADILRFEHTGNITDFPEGFFIPDKVIKNMETQCSIFDAMVSDPFKMENRFREVEVCGHLYKYWNYYYPPSNVSARQNSTHNGRVSQRLDFIDKDNEIMLFKLQLKGCTVLRQVSFKYFKYIYL
jgi:hypothetical protein